MANDGVPMHVIQKFLGHANVATTGIYTELAGGELVDVLKKSNANTMVGELLEAARRTPSGRSCSSPLPCCRIPTFTGP